MAAIKSAFLFGLLSTTVLASPAKRDTGKCRAGRRTINGKQYTISCGLDRAGGDYADLQTTFEGCVSACSGASKCVSAQYHEDNGFCYLKTVANSAFASSIADTIDAGSACKESTTVMLSGLSCKISCATDRHGGDYAESYTGNYFACAQACASDSKCKTAQYNEGNGYCYLKDTLPEAVSSTDTDSIVCERGSSTTTTSAKTTPATTTSAKTTPATTTSASTTSATPKTTPVAKQPDGYSCASNSDCESAYCKPAGKYCARLNQPDGATCFANDECTSGLCPNGKCGKLPNDATCSTSSDCTSNYCNPSKKCANKGSAGSSCISNSECTSNQCTSTNYCGPTPNGYLCGQNKDCQSNYCYVQAGGAGYGNCQTAPK